MTPRMKMRRLVDDLEKTLEGIDRQLCFMEVCGTHTVSACRSGVHSLMPDRVRLISGPGCPVCVTAQSFIDALIHLGSWGDVILATYGDMLRVTGAGGSLEIARSRGADVRVVTSTMEALEIAKSTPDRQVVFAAVGFETTAPATAAAILTAERLHLDNFSVLPSHKLVVPAMTALLQDPRVRVDGFLCPGHVSVVIGAEMYRPIVERYGKPCVVSGFEPLQIMEGIVHLAKQVRAQKPQLENLYPEVVTAEGNPHAQQLIREVFKPGNAAWRALGIIDWSGLDLQDRFRRFDAFEKFGVTLGQDIEPKGCRCGEVITGRCLPDECALFGKTCTPVHAIGPCMVSSEGSCQAWFKYRRHEISKAREVTA